VSPTRSESRWNARPRRRVPSGTLPVLALALAAVGGVVGLLIATGTLRLGEETFVPPEGKIAVPISPRKLPAYRKLTLDDLVSPRTGRVAALYFEPEQVREEMLTDLTKIVGRVLQRTKPAGFAFTERDFAPEGTRAGLSAGVPPGRRAMRVDVSQVPGLQDLAVGDRFDLVATLPLESDALETERIGGIRAADLTTLDPGLANWRKQATVDVIVQNGLLVAPMTTREVPVYVNTLTQGAVTRTRPVQEVVIALAAEEVARLTQALAVGARVQAVIRSGHPDEPADSVTPDHVPRSPFGYTAERDGGGGGGGYTILETISGSERRYLAVGEGLVPPAPTDERAEAAEEPRPNAPTAGEAPRDP